MSRPRRIALGLMAHAGRVFPYARSAWTRAMQEEITHIENDGEALRWALGCVFTSYRERLFAMKLMQTRAARIVLALVLFDWAMGGFFAPAHLLHNAVIGLAGMIGVRAADPGHFNALLGLTPLWLQVLWLAVGVALLLSAWAVLRGKSYAFTFFVAATACQVLTAFGIDFLDQMVPAYHQAALTAYAFAASGLRRYAFFVPGADALLFVCMAAALWQSVGRTPKPV